MKQKHVLIMLIQQINNGKIICVKIMDAITGVVVYRARGKYIIPMEAELSEFKNFNKWVKFVEDNWREDK